MLGTILKTAGTIWALDKVFGDGKIADNVEKKAAETLKNLQKK